MKQCMKWISAGLVVAAAALSGCGSGGSNNYNRHDTTTLTRSVATGLEAAATLSKVKSFFGAIALDNRAVSRATGFNSTLGLYEVDQPDGSSLYYTSATGTSPDPTPPVINQGPKVPSGAGSGYDQAINVTNYRNIQTGTVTLHSNESDSFRTGMVSIDLTSTCGFGIQGNITISSNILQDVTHTPGTVNISGADGTQVNFTIAPQANTFVITGTVVDAQGNSAPFTVNPDGSSTATVFDQNHNQLGSVTLSPDLTMGTVHFADGTTQTITLTCGAR